MDSRKSKRVPIGVSVNISWADQDGCQHEERAITRDISSKGMYLRTNSLPPIGVIASLEILFLLRHATSVRVRTKAKVIRVQHQHESQTKGFAVITQQFGFPKN